MKFINLRELHVDTAKVLARVSRGEKLIVTNRGKPQAIIAAITSDDLERLDVPLDLLIASESSLKTDWLKPEEDKAWKGL